MSGQKTCRMCLMEHDPAVAAMPRNNGEMACLGYAAGFVESRVIGRLVASDLCEKHAALVAFYGAAALKMAVKCDGGETPEQAAEEVVAEMRSACEPSKGDLS